ncbi:hypothetical protein BJF78_16725 [Pseudonocardia sp. CNS-139]|nr:hypothetical protein BJF78_16725 [Pseudonocardia sp. CNS-139]
MTRGMRAGMVAAVLALGVVACGAPEMDPVSRTVPVVPEARTLPPPTAGPAAPPPDAGPSSGGGSSSSGSDDEEEEDGDPQTSPVWRRTRGPGRSTCPPRSPSAAPAAAR